MKRTQLGILLLLLIVLGATAWWLLARRTHSWQSSSTHELPAKLVSLPINDVTKVTITQPTGQLNLVKKGDLWVVAERDDYPANYEMVSSLIRKVWELKPVQQVDVGPSQLGRLELLDPGKGSNAGTLVDFKDAQGKSLAKLLFGKKYMREASQSFGPGRSFPAGRYVMPEGKSHQVSLVTDPFGQIDEKPERWLDRTFLQVGKPTSITSTGSAPEMNWKLEKVKDSSEWTLANAGPDEKLDEAKAKQVAASAGNLSNFTDVLGADAKKESTGLDKPRTFRVTTEDDMTYVLNVGQENGDNYQVTISVSGEVPKTRTPGPNEKPEEKDKLDKDFKTRQEAAEKKLKEGKKLEGRIFLVPKFSVAQLEKTRSELLAPKPTPTPSPTASPTSTQSPSPTAKPAKPKRR
jgi:hypothetical protein